MEDGEDGTALENRLEGPRRTCLSRTRPETFLSNREQLKL